MKIKSHLNKIALAFAGCSLILFCITAYALTNNLLAGGTIESSELFNGPATIRMVQIIMNPGDTIPWHYHPGRAYVIVCPRL